MDVFKLRDQLVGDYADYIRSFLTFRDDRIREHVDTSLREGHLWPDPMIGLNPAFESGGAVDDLVADDVLHRECSNIFRVGKTPDAPLGEPMRLYRHQVDAIRAARAGRNYVLTTGTGSGKSLAYIVPIVDHVLRHGTGRGVQAIVVYPMNALANSQEGELRKYLGIGYGDRPPVTFRRYTGQESDDERRAILADPPDVILTNYVMLELILTRVHDRHLVNAAEGLRFLVLDELHTYRGRQGADVALLARRVREACHATALQCIGTSATLASRGSHAERQAEVARVAGLLFGAEVEPRDVIGETLRRATRSFDPDDDDFVASLRARLGDGTAPPTTYDEFVADPLSRWVESTFGVEERDGRLERVTPRAIGGAGGAAAELAALTGIDRGAGEAAIARQLLAGYDVKVPDSPFPAFAFRLHQFISKGDTVYASPEPEPDRYLTLNYQRFVPGDRGRALLPLCFCRACGQEYYTVRRRTDPPAGEPHFVPRPLNDRGVEDGERAGFLYLCTDPDGRWDDQALERLPEDWLEADGTGQRVKRDQRKLLPERVWVAPDGTTGAADSAEAWFVPAPFRFCLRCGVAYGGQFQSDFSKLATLGSEGRSTATTILSLAAIRYLRGLGADDELRPEARKLLSFTDNRQDASLQAGHFNDFLQVGQLRAALLRAVAGAGPEGLSHERLTGAVAAALDLPFGHYAVDPELRYRARDETEAVLRDVLGYRLYHDLRRGWRVTAPNLEQCGLLRIDYLSLGEAAADDSLWDASHAALVAARPEQRFEAARVLLDFLRRELAIKVEYLDRRFQEELQRRSSQRLQGPWALDETETRLTYAAVAVARSKRPSDRGEYLYVSPRGGYGRFLRRPSTLGVELTVKDSADIIRDLFDRLRQAGLVEAVRGRVPGREAEPDPGELGYQIPAAAMRWVPGDGTAAVDPIRTPRAPDVEPDSNAFFVELYRGLGPADTGIEAREHTAQVPYEMREEREQAFREARLPVLFCSPTMELGVDIAELNVVNLRNVPPTPANYAQRSGRAGRSGSPALVFTYATTGSPHDQYFFRHAVDMVAGAVTPPRLDLTNEDLVRSHVHAVWLTESGLSLGRSLTEILDDRDHVDVPLREHIVDDLRRPEPRHRARDIAVRVLADLDAQLESAPWWSDQWLDDVLNGVPQQFDRACARWRDLYRAAQAQFDQQSRIIQDVSRAQSDKTTARRLRSEAEAQLTLLSAESAHVNQSDFYSYRYFAAEGFLPGYSFPRLPLSAFIPGRARRRHGPEGEYLSRPRFLAISEFGPQSLVYHEGARYQITKVVLPPRDVTTDGPGVLTAQAKRCDACGYIHPINNDHQPDLCEECGARLGPPVRRLFRMQNVATRRRDRINSDEEERQRQGFEIWTGVRFATRQGRLSMHKAEATVGGDVVATLTYGDTAQLWRINVGRRRRTVKDRLGFVLDVERGFWRKDSDEITDPDEAATTDTAPTERVIPYVEDDRNCLLLTPAVELDRATMASLQAALKHAIQATYQLEDDELAAEALPDPERRRSLMFYEAAEGGAGVLRRLLDPDALAQVAAKAIELCHVDPATGTELPPPPGAEACEAACYRCLLSYYNQPDHQILDRALAVEVLAAWRDATVTAGSGPATPEQHSSRLERSADSELERAFLEYLREHRCRAPDRAGALIAEAGTRPDFVYDDACAAVYVDGPPHAYPDRRARDADVTARLRDLGWTVIRVGAHDDWDRIVEQYRWVFGGPG